MPEQLTKHPEVTLQVLRSAGATCAAQAPQAILTQCPADRFCKLPGGELCVYGLADAAQMTQLSPSDWGIVQAQIGRVASAPEPGLAAPVWIAGALAVLLGAGLGFGLGRSARRWR